MDELPDLRSRSTIIALKAQFSRHGIPRTIRSDNGPQYAAAEFREFCREFGITHKTSSPHTPHSNGEAEKAVQTVKRLWKKADRHLALLDYRTTPLEGINLSPAQLLMGRRPRNLLPASRELLLPTAYNRQEVKHRLDHQKVAQKYYYDKSSHDLRPLRSGEQVRMAPFPGSSKWSPGVVVETHSSPRSYVVQSGNRNYRRNRQDLRPATQSANQPEHFSDTREEMSEPNQDLAINSVPDTTTGHISPQATPVKPNTHIVRATPNQNTVTRSGRIIKPRDVLNL